VSPWTVGGFVCTELSDHTSQLRFLEHVTGIRETNISQWRRDTVGDLTSAFRFSRPGKPPALPDTQGQFNLSQYEISQFPLPAIPTGNQHLPRQEPGSRPRIP
jgi:phospholipase C